MSIGIATAIFAFIPALIANSLAVIFGGRFVIDAGRTIGGKRILGDGKTWSGLIGGTVSAGIIGTLLAYAGKQSISIHTLPTPGIYIIFTLAFGSLMGDMCASFIKRRLGRKRGEKTPFVDQYDFVIGALFMSWILYPSWTKTTFFSRQGLIGLALILIIVPFLHRTVNIIGYKTGYKKEPW